MKNISNSNSDISSFILKTIAILIAGNINVFEIKILKIGRTDDYASHMSTINITSYFKFFHQHLFKRLVLLADKQLWVSKE